MLRQADNNVRIEGILSETNLNCSTFVKNGETREYIGGSIKVLVETEVDGKPVNLEIPVYMFSTKYTNAGKLNPSYESIEKVMKEFVSIAAAGNKEGADKIRITSGSIKMNDFFGQDGRIISQPRINASFVSHATGSFKPEASFHVEFLVSSINRVVDRNGVELDPAKVEVQVVIPQYGDRVDVAKFYAVKPSVINAIESYWESGCGYKASGRLDFSSTTEEVTEEQGFGEPITRVKTVTRSEFIITGGSQEALDSEYGWDMEEIKTALAERKVRIEETKTKKSVKKAPAKPELDLGF